MNKRQENKLSSYIAVKTVCDAKKDILTTIQGVDDTYARFTEMLKKLQGSLQVQTVQIGGITANKQGATDQLIDQSLDISGIIHAYANRVGNEELKKRVDYVRTDFERLRDTLLTEVARELLDNALAVLSDLADYGVTAETLDQFKSRIDEYDRIVAAPRAAIVERKTATESISELFKTIDTLLTHELDRLMESYHTIHPEFYRDYFSARSIVDSGIRKKSVVSE